MIGYVILGLGLGYFLRIYIWEKCRGSIHTPPNSQWYYILNEDAANKLLDRYVDKK